MNLTGQTFNFWRVIQPTKGRPYYYDCECLKCGEIYQVYQNTLKNGKGKMCRACATKERAEKSRVVHDEIIGKWFGRLNVTGWTTDSKNRTVYICQCKCGNKITVPYDLLINGKTSSCGCLRSDMSKKSIEKTYDRMRSTQKNARIDGTIAYTLTDKAPKSSSTGAVGVSKMASGKYRAYINLAGKQHHLGTFGTLSEAIEARKGGEEKYFKPIIEKYEENKKSHSPE